MSPPGINHPVHALTRFHTLFVAAGYIKDMAYEVQ